MAQGAWSGPRLGEGPAEARRRREAGGTGDAAALLRGELHPEPLRRVRPRGAPGANILRGARLQRRGLRGSHRGDAARVPRRHRAAPGRAVVVVVVGAEGGGARRGALAPRAGPGARRHCGGDPRPTAPRGGGAARGRGLRGRGRRRAVGGGAGGLPEGGAGAPVVDRLPAPYGGRDAVERWHQRAGVQARIWRPCLRHCRRRRSPGQERTEDDCILGVGLELM